MMRARLLLLLSMIAIAPGAFAQDVLVKSGEHSNFSRLVFYHGSSKPSLQRQSDGVARLEFEGMTGLIDTSNVFEFIPRDRVEELDVDGDNVSIVLGCECSLEGFSLSPDIYVLDVRDGVVSEGAVEQGYEEDESRGYISLGNKREKFPVVFGDAPAPHVDGGQSGQVMSEKRDTTNISPLSIRADENPVFDISQSIAGGRLLVAPGVPSGSPGSDANRRMLHGLELATVPYLRSRGGVGDVVKAIPSRQMCSPSAKTFFDLVSSEVLSPIEGGGTSPDSLQYADLDDFAILAKFAEYFLSGFVEEAAVIREFLANPDWKALSGDFVNLTLDEDVAVFSMLPTLIDCGSSADFWILLADSNAIYRSNAQVMGALEVFNALEDGLAALLIRRVEGVFSSFGLASEFRDLSNLKSDLEGPVSDLTGAEHTLSGAKEPGNLREYSASLTSGEVESGLTAQSRLNEEAMIHTLAGTPVADGLSVSMMNDFLRDGNYYAAWNLLVDVHGSSYTAEDLKDKLFNEFRDAVMVDASDGALLALRDLPGFDEGLFHLGEERSHALLSKINSRIDGVFSRLDFFEGADVVGNVSVTHSISLDEVAAENSELVVGKRGFEGPEQDSSRPQLDADNSSERLDEFRKLLMQTEGVKRVAEEYLEKPDI